MMHPQPCTPSRRILAFACAVPALCVALSAPVRAADAPAAAPGAYLTGGIGEEERTDMLAVRGQYNLRLIFAQARTGEYLSGVSVSIRKSGSDVEMGPYEGAGPWFFVRLDPGNYRIGATYEGVTQTRTVRIGRSASERAFYWPSR